MIKRNVQGNRAAHVRVSASAEKAREQEEASCVECRGVSVVRGGNGQVDWRASLSDDGAAGIACEVDTIDKFSDTEWC